MAGRGRAHLKPHARRSAGRRLKSQSARLAKQKAKGSAVLPVYCQRARSASVGLEAGCLARESLIQKARGLIFFV